MVAHILPDSWCRNEDDTLNWLGNLSNAYYHHTRWLRPWFWKYCLRRREDRAWGSWISTVWCRAKGHPNGEIFYNPGGMEPDHRCKDCGEEIG